MTLKETEEYITKRILLHYNYDESRSIAKIALMYILKLDNINYSMTYHNEVPSGAFAQIHEYINHLQWAEPIQYITGEAHFMGFDFLVTPDVLIPRRETEELVSLILEENKSKLNPVVLDIGTGSGCIPIVIKKFMNNAKVYAIDISEKALDIASRNAMKLRADIEFLRANILETEDLLFDTFDVIVSNPPYVTEAEKELMHRNVLEYEPHLALFVPDNDALMFYKKITALAAKRLTTNGKLYFEINEKYAKEVQAIMQENNFSEINIIQDMQGKDRIVRGQINN
jgi:release factor glutamine methyltransferase